MAVIINETAYLGNGTIGFQFKYNPQSLSWGYQQNVGTFDTIGGRVYQVLSVSPTTLTVQGQAGNRYELQVMAKGILDIMNYHINSQSPVNFVVPSRKLNMSVYVVAMPQIGWDYTTVVYPYQLQLSIEEDFGISPQDILTNQIDLLAADIGFTTTFEGGSPADFQKIVSQVQNAVLADSISTNAPGFSGGATPSNGNPSVGYQQNKSAVAQGWNQAGWSLSVATTLANSKQCFAWLNTESAGTWNPAIVSRPDNAGEVNGGLFQFAYAWHPEVRKYFTKGGYISGAQGNSFTMSVVDQAAFSITGLGLKPDDVIRYGNQVFRHQYPYWPNYNP